MDALPQQMVPPKMQQGAPKMHLIKMLNDFLMAA